ELGVTPQAVQTLLSRARRALRDELELGMTCAHARRVALRHLNSVALRAERWPLQRHLRKCANCATCDGRTPTTPIVCAVWVGTPPGTAGVQAPAAVEVPSTHSEATPDTAVSMVLPDSADPTAAPQDSASAVVGNADSAAADSPPVDGTADPAVDTSGTPPSD